MFELCEKLYKKILLFLLEKKFFFGINLFKLEINKKLSSNLIIIKSKFKSTKKI